MIFGSPVRVINVVDLMRLQSPTEHPHGLPDHVYDTLFPPNTPTIFAFTATRGWCTG